MSDQIDTPTEIAKIDSLFSQLSNRDMRHCILELDLTDDNFNRLVQFDKAVVNFSSAVKYTIGKFLISKRAEIRKEKGDWKAYLEVHSISERTDRKYRDLVKKVDKLVKLNTSNPDYKDWLLDHNLTEIFEAYIEAFPSENKGKGKSDSDTKIENMSESQLRTAMKKARKMHSKMETELQKWKDDSSAKDTRIQELEEQLDQASSKPEIVIQPRQSIPGLGSQD